MHARTHADNHHKICQCAQDVQMKFIGQQFNVRLTARLGAACFGLNINSLTGESSL